MLDILRLHYKQEVDETECFHFSFIVYNNVIQFILNIINLYLTFIAGLTIDYYSSYSHMPSIFSPHLYIRSRLGRYDGITVYQGI